MDFYAGKGLRQHMQWPQNAKNLMSLFKMKWSQLNIFSSTPCMPP